MDRHAAAPRALAAVATLAFSCAGRPAAPRAPEPAAPAAAATVAAMTAPAGYIAMRVMAVGPTGDGGHMVVLADEGRQRLLPLAIGGTEAASIALRHSGESFARPLTHDLLDSLLRTVGAELVKVQVDELRDGVFIGSVFVSHGGRVTEVDARPSDAIALALGRGLPVYVAEEVVARGGIRSEDLPTEAPETMPPAPDLPAPAPDPAPRP